jgi:hypothetical protein
VIYILWYLACLDFIAGISGEVPKANSSTEVFRSFPQSLDSARIIWSNRPFLFFFLILRISLSQKSAVISGSRSIKVHKFRIRMRLSITRAGLAQWYSAGLWARWSGVSVPAGAGKFYVYHRLQTGSRAHRASYPMGARGSFPGRKAAGAWSWPHTSI